MPGLDSALLDLGGFDALAARPMPAQRIDPRAKLLAALVFLLTVVSYPRHALGAMLPLALFPVALAALGGVPAGFILRRVLIAAPFAFCVGVFNPLIDREPFATIGGLVVSSGWVTFASILLRFALTVGAVLVLVAVTGFLPLCLALDRLGSPRALTLQFMMLYRYIFVLADEAQRMRRAWMLRAGGRKRPGAAEFGHLAGSLLLRAFDRAHRVHGAMLSRGFGGGMRLARELHFRPADGLFLAAWIAFFIAARRFDLPAILGDCVAGAFQ